MNIDQVARLAQVSTATVSRTLNGSSAVRPATAAKIRKIMDDFGYIPNQSARTLSSGHSRILAVIVSDLTNPFVAELVNEFEKQCSAHGYDAIIASTGLKPSGMEHCIQRMVERQVDGIAVFSSEIDPRSASLLDRYRIPAVGLAYSVRQSAFDVLEVDYGCGLAAALAHLSQLGHKRIGFITGPQKLYTARVRIESFGTAMAQAGLKLNAAWVKEGDFRTRGGLDAMNAILGEKKRPTAVVCSNDQMALAAMQAIRDAGLQVPKDFSVIGTDDVEAAALASPPLTTIRIPREMLAQSAMEMLLSASSRELRKKGLHKLIRTSLAIRKSTAALRQRD